MCALFQIRTSVKHFLPLFYPIFFFLFPVVFPPSMFYLRNNFFLFRAFKDLQAWSPFFFIYLTIMDTKGFFLCLITRTCETKLLQVLEKLNKKVWLIFLGTDRTKKEKYSGKLNRSTFTTAFLFFSSVKLWSRNIAKIFKVKCIEHLVEFSLRTLFPDLLRKCEREGNFIAPTRKTWRRNASSL